MRVEGNLFAGLAAQMHHMPDGTYPDFEKLIEVGRINGKKFNLLEKGHRIVHSFLQNPVVERQPA